MGLHMREYDMGKCSQRKLKIPLEYVFTFLNAPSGISLFLWNRIQTSDVQWNSWMQHHEPIFPLIHTRKLALVESNTPPMAPSEPKWPPLALGLQESLLSCSAFLVHKFVLKSKDLQVHTQADNQQIYASKQFTSLHSGKWFIIHTYLSVSSRIQVSFNLDWNKRSLCTWQSFVCIVFLISTETKWHFSSTVYHSLSNKIFVTSFLIFGGCNDRALCMR